MKNGLIEVSRIKADVQLSVLLKTTTIELTHKVGSCTGAKDVLVYKGHTEFPVGLPKVILGHVLADVQEPHSHSV